MTDDGLRFSFDGDVERITLADPARRNALGLERMQALTAHLQAIDVSASASVVVIDAEGPAFSAGHDLSQMCGSGTGEAHQVLPLFFFLRLLKSIQVFDHNMRKFMP